MNSYLSAKTERYHGLDLLRAFAMMLGLLIHANEAYQIPEIAKAMGMPSFINLPGWMDLMEVWIHLWRMPLFFVLAGFFGCMIVQRRGGVPARSAVARWPDTTGLCVYLRPAVPPTFF